MNINPIEGTEEMSIESKKKKKKEQTYIYQFCGDFWANSKNYQIEVAMPTKYKTVKEAKGDKSSLRFEKRDNHIVLVVYSSWEQGFVNGKWHESVAGEVLDIIKWEHWYKYKISVAKDNVFQKVIIDGMSDFVPDATPWDELFSVESLDDNWCCTVESLAYFICSYFS